MSIQEISIITGAFLSFLVFIFHTMIYKLFHWQEEFIKISPLNAKIFYTLNLATALFILLFAIISIIYFKELARCEGLAFGICLAYSLFWLWRTVWQVIYFKSKEGVAVKNGSKQDIIMKYSLMAVFSCLFASYIIPVLKVI